MSFWNRVMLACVLTAAVGSVGCAASSAKPARSNADAPPGEPTAASNAASRYVEIPGWLPVPPGVEVKPAYFIADGANRDGGFGFTQDESVQAVVAWYRKRLEAAGLRIEEYPVRRPGSEQVTLIATGEGVVARNSNSATSGVKSTDSDSTSKGTESTDSDSARVTSGGSDSLREERKVTIMLAGGVNRCEIQIRYVVTIREP